MEKSEATHLAAGGIFFAVGALALSILIPLAAAARPSPWTAGWFLVPCAVAAVFGVAGLYTVVAVYAGLPLPPTANERSFAPKLAVSDAYVVRAQDGKILFRIAIHNSGRGNIADAVVNVVAPAFFTGIRRCMEDAEPHPLPGTSSRTLESLVNDDEGRPISSISWLGTVDFPGRTFRILYFQADTPSPRDFPVRLGVTAPALDKHFRTILELSPGARA